MKLWKIFLKPLLKWLKLKLNGMFRDSFREMEICQDLIVVLHSRYRRKQRTCIMIERDFNYMEFEDVKLKIGRI